MMRSLAILVGSLTIAVAVAPRIARGDAVDAIFLETGKSAADSAGNATPETSGKAATQVAEPSSPGIGVTGLDAATNAPHTLNHSASQAESDIPFTAVPEPSAIILALAAFAYFLLFARRRRI